MAREKRPLEKDAATEGMPEGKRQRVPALASVIVEAVKMDSLQKLCSTLEPLLRRVAVLVNAVNVAKDAPGSDVEQVGEEVERVLAKLSPAKVGFRSSPKRIQGPDARSLRLQFRNKLSLPLFTGSKVEGEQGSAIHVVLQDASSGEVVTGGAEASAKLEIVVLEGDFSLDDDEDWPQEDFENHEVRERDGKRPLLTGDLSVTLKEGVGTLGELTFTDNSSWIRSRKFRLGVKISSGYCEGLRIREAKTDAFTVKDHRGELLKPPYSLMKQSRSYDDGVMPVGYVLLMVPGSFSRIGFECAAVVVLYNPSLSFLVSIRSCILFVALVAMLFCSLFKLLVCAGPISNVELV
ncbi:hypothetical protein AXG93_3671s1300 [Marchantia polymorpha subsp. ruderalis]|uniref:Calmodulin binding protein-like N-terminal domain-containing protein n=1 Tax=Marchantia polymorpha subsp. ruderalis TaxID=1480154 RepID=A0A176WIJ1_MARPO|nr:hypothetical protein AXG93_3671s1300 [Marchantia polymorpha subsp. ruderalis]